MVLKLYKLDGSPPVRAVFMVINALDISDVEYIDVNLLEGDHLKEDYTKINPQHTIPLLLDDDFAIWDSHAIAAYLVDKYGESDSLYPADLKKRAVIDQRLHFDSGILFPAARGAIEPILFWSEKTFKPEGLAKIKAAYGHIEKFLTNTWLAGDEITLADICCVATVSSMDLIIPIDENEYPKLSDWLKRCAEQDFYKKGNKDGLNALRELLKSKLF